MASPRSTSAWRAGSASDSPSKSATTRVSAAVSSGRRRCGLRRGSEPLSGPSLEARRYRCRPPPAVKESRRICPRPSSSEPPARRSASSAAASSTLDATELGGTTIAAALERAEVAPEQVQHVVFGQVLQAGQGQIPSRQAQIKGGIPKEVSSETVNKVCASGPARGGIVDQAVRAGDLDVAVAGGMESMSNAPYLLKGARFGFRMGDAKAHRRDDARRPHQPVQRQGHGGGGRRGGRGTGDHPRGHGQVRPAQPRARDPGHRRGAPARGDRARHGQDAEGRDHDGGGRGAAAREHARVARRAQGRIPQGRARTRPATPRA